MVDFFLSYFSSFAKKKNKRFVLVAGGLVKAVVVGSVDVERRRLSWRRGRMRARADVEKLETDGLYAMVMKDTHD